MPCNAAQCGCNCHRFTSPDVAAAAGARLADMWDRARDLQSRAGLRPYSVSIVRARVASGARRGDGPTEIVHEWQILPTPKIGDLSGLQEILGPDQLREMGTLQLTEISLRYTEDQLLGRGPDGDPIPPDEVVFYEIRYLGAGGQVTQRRRFVSASAPNADMARAQWTINLTRAPHDRNRNGTLR